MTDIRIAGRQDVPGAYRVCLETGDAGMDATALYSNRDLLGHVYVGPYLFGEPDLAFVAADARGVAGYLLAAENTAAFDVWAEREWWPPLRAQYPMPVAADRSPDGEITRLLHRPETSPAAVVADYPAHLHIDLLPRLQGRGFGRRMIELLIATLRARSCPGVHLGVDPGNHGAIGFYRHLGFTEVAATNETVYMGVSLT